MIGDLDFFERFLAGLGTDSGSWALPFLTILTRPSSAEGMECPVATTGWFSFMALTGDTMAVNGEALSTAGLPADNTSLQLCR
jgi:hypothetical protein